MASRSTEEQDWNGVRTRVESKGTVTEARDESGAIGTSVSQGAAAMKMRLVDLHLQERHQLRPQWLHSENHPCICAKATPPMGDLLPMTCFGEIWDSFFGWL